MESPPCLVRGNPLNPFKTETCFMAKLRTKEIKIRLSEPEYQRLLDKKTTTHLAKYIRDVALSDERQRVKKTVAPKLILELARIGNNVNQLARFCNASERIAADDAFRIMASLELVSVELKELLTKYDC